MSLRARALRARASGLRAEARLRVHQGELAAASALRLQAAELDCKAWQMEQAAAAAVCDGPAGPEVA